MTQHVTYALADGVATIVMDDGKANALSVDMQSDVRAALDQAEADGAIVVLAGREGRFSAGFDMAVISGGDGAAVMRMVSGGFELAERLMSFPRPVVAACTGHAIAMAMFLLLSSDYRVGAAGAYKLTANEVAIGLPMPRAAVEISKGRLTPAALDRALNLAEVFSPADAVSVGILDLVVAPDEVIAKAQSVAAGFTTLNMTAHAATKLTTRSSVLAGLRSAIAEMKPPS